MTTKDTERYLALVGPSSESPAGNVDSEAEYLVDAIPVEELRSLNDRTAARRSEPLKFLALTTRRPLVADHRGSHWIEIQVSDEQAGGDGLIPADSAFPGGEIDTESGSLFVSVSDGAPDTSLLVGLEKMSRFDWIQDAREEEIASLMHRHSDVIAVGVYDVGQASMTALVDEFEHPLIFFDLGWPLNFNKKSHPSNKAFNPLINLNGTDAPVVLSHLDWDHWGYAVESGAARKEKATGVWLTGPVYKSSAMCRPWIMGRPDAKRHALGPSHIHFVQSLANMSVSTADTKLHFWPGGKKAIKSGGVSLIKCNPAKKTPTSTGFLRNNESLALLVRSGRAAVLLCGDADYPSIPSKFKRGLTGVVAPHHGGRTTEGSMPRPIGHGRMVFSSYAGCYSSIPCDDVLREASSKGWRVSCTDDRIACDRCGELHGNRLICLSVIPICGCGGVVEAGLCITKPW